MNDPARIERSATAAKYIVRCLGRFRIEHSSSNQVSIRTRKSRAVLAALALPGIPMTRDALADLLWSSRGAAQARSSLRQSIFELQHALGADAQVLIADRDTVSVRRELIVTDVELIRMAAAEGDWPRLLALLESSEQGLLVDLDGLDEQFDDWLRIERAQEPEKTLSTAVGAVEKCLTEAGPRAAFDLVSEILRLDPVNEEATRLAMRINHELGDSRGLHRNFGALSGRLRAEYDAEPSAETQALFHRLADATPARKPKPTGPAIVSTGAMQSGPGIASRSRWRLAFVPLAAAAAMVGVSAVGLSGGSLDKDPARQIVVAVLPFDHQPQGDSFLASGIWEHTRAALTRNGSLRVLGRSTTAAMADRKLSPDQYLRRLGVTHLLEGSVRRSGDDVLISVSLAQTADGVIVWQDMFRGRMHEPLALQDAVANGIEGKLRGRLARDGGRRAEQIVTTPEVYGLYSEARHLIGSRKRPNFRRAEALLREAVATDANYAPAWSLLGAAIYFNGRIAIVDSQARTEALRSVRRALTLAPNLGQAHATLALIEGESSPAGERALRRAVELDPNYAEAWNWLGNSLNSQHRYREAIGAYQRAVEIDPLLDVAIINLARSAIENGDRTAADRLIANIERAGADPVLIASVRATELQNRRDYSEAVQTLTGAGFNANGHPPGVLWLSWLETLTGLGHYDRLHAITDCPDWYGPLLAGDTLPPKTFDGKPVRPEEFWTSIFFSTPASRALINRGRTVELLRLYKQAFRTPDEFISKAGRHNLLIELAPLLAVALQLEGARQEAAYILAAASNELEPALEFRANGTARGQLAAVRAAQGERAQAIALLEMAIRQKWLPDGRAQPLDLAGNPAFRSLRGDPRFEAARRSILEHIARERAELGPRRA